MCHSTCRTATLPGKTGAGPKRGAYRNGLNISPRSADEISERRGRTSRRRGIRAKTVRVSTFGKRGRRGAPQISTGGAHGQMEIDSVTAGRFHTESHRPHRFQPLSYRPCGGRGGETSGYRHRRGYPEGHSPQRIHRRTGNPGDAPLPAYGIRPRFHRRYSASPEKQRVSPAPLLDERGRVRGIETVSTLKKPPAKENPVLLMAGGRG